MPPEFNPDDAIDPNQSGDEGGSAGGAGPAPWQSYVDRFPEQSRQQAAEIFREWDGNVTRQQQSVQSQYAPWRSFADAGYEPQYVTAATQLLDQIRTNPQEIIPWLASEAGVNWGGQGDQGAPAASEQQPEWMSNLPPELVDRLGRMDKVEQLAELLGQTMLQQQEEQQLNSELADFDNYLAELAKQYGEFDEDWVLAKIEAQQMTPEQAVQGWHEQRQIWAAEAARGRAPRILGNGGGLPSNHIDPRSMNRSQTRDLVAQLAMEAQE